MTGGVDLLAASESIVVDEVGEVDFIFGGLWDDGGLYWLLGGERIAEGVFSQILTDKAFGLE